MRKLLPFISIGYSVILVILSLANIKTPTDLPEGNDKVFHAIAYFVFTILWFFSIYFSSKSNKNKALKIAIVASIVFGIVIEVLQHTLTLSRQADYKDIIANIIGTLVAVIIINHIIKMKVKKD